MNTLIIAEKPSVALRIAIALGNNSQKRLNLNGVSYYEIDQPTGKIYVAAAVGHLFTIRQSDSERGYPVLEVKWSASYEVNKNSYYTKKYLDVFKSLAHKSDSFINACDFDIEGTVIGTNIVRFIGTDLIKKSKRMKFSTTTIPDIKNAFENLMPLDMPNFYAGEVRHMLDWLWGINLSRALTSSLVGTKFTRSLSIGRVQGPTLALLAKRELEIEKFQPKAYWNLLALIKEIEFKNIRSDIFEKKEAEKSLHETNSNLKNAIVEEVEAQEQLVRPYPPFDLTTLQLEASRVLRFDPSITLSTAQTLYERAYISYPRTSSQKLPPTLGLTKVINDLAKNPKYKDMANRLISEKRYRPNEGMKTDDAHPAIYPTGVMPKELTDPESKLYDLIVKRFIACFAPYAKVAKVKVTVKVGNERYVANGTTTIEKGWFEFYEFSAAKDKFLPEFKKGSNVEVSKSYMQELQTQPPRRFGKAGLIAELEKRTLGTKATRAAVIDTLFKRSYIEGSAIKVTSFGMSVYKTLQENSEMIVNEETTRKLEEDMQKISEGKKEPEEVINEGKKMLLEALKVFDSNKTKIAESMQKGLVDSEVKLGACIKDGGDLVIRKSKIGKQFVACSNYPNCTNTYSVPQNALIVSANKVCEHCKTPIIKVIRKGRGVFEMDLDPNCITKDKWKKKQELKKGIDVKTGKEIKAESIAKIPNGPEKKVVVVIERKPKPIEQKLGAGDLPIIPERKIETVKKINTVQQKTKPKQLKEKKLIVKKNVKASKIVKKKKQEK